MTIPANTAAAPGGSYRRFSINAAASMCALALAIGIGFWYTPYLIRQLGVSTYGLVPLASSITNYLTIITSAVCTTVARYITMDLARGDLESANRNFNTFLVIGLAMTGILLIFAVGVSFALPTLFNIPAGMEAPARAVFIGVTSAFLLSTLSNTFESAIWVSNRFEIRSLIESSSLLLRIGLVVLFFHLWPPSLFLVAIALPIPAFGSLLTNMAVCRKLVPSLRIRWADFDRTRLPALWYTSRWVFMGQLGNVLFLNIDLVLANVLLGAEAGGHYAPMIQWTALLRAVGMLVAGILAPAIVTRRAQEDQEGLLRVTRHAAKFMGLFIALPVGLLCGFSKPLIATWLPPAFTDIASLSWCLLLPLCAEVAHYHFGSVLIAADRVRGISIATLILGCGNVLLGILLVSYLNWGLLGIAAAGTIASLLRNLLYSPVYVARVLGLRWFAFLPSIVKVYAMCLMLAAVSAWVAQYVVPGSWLRLGMVAAPLALLYLAFAYFFVLTSEERTTLRRIVLR